MILAMNHRRRDLWGRQANLKSLRYCSSSEFGPRVSLTLTILIVQMLHSLRHRRSHASNLNGVSRRKMFERAVQTSPDVEMSDGSGGRNINLSAPAKVSPCFSDFYELWLMAPRLSSVSLRQLQLTVSLDKTHLRI